MGWGGNVGVVTVPVPKYRGPCNPCTFVCGTQGNMHQGQESKGDTYEPRTWGFLQNTADPSWSSCQPCHNTILWSTWQEVEVA